MTAVGRLAAGLGVGGLRGGAAAAGGDHVLRLDHEHLASVLPESVGPARVPLGHPVDEGQVLVRAKLDDVPADDQEAPVIGSVHH